MLKKNHSCLIFDYDGVIANTDLGRFNLLKSILLSYNIRLPDHFTQMDLIGLSTKAFLVKNFPNLTHHEIDNIVERRYELFFSNLPEYCIPYEKMKEAITYFSSRFDLALVTTNSVENVKVQLKYLGIIDYFKWTIGREKSESKGLIKTYALIPEVLKKEISECIVIEDSDFGVNAARKEGFFCIRFDPEYLFEKGNENERANSYIELIAIIDKYTTC